MGLNVKHTSRIMTKLINCKIHDKSLGTLAAKARSLYSAPNAHTYVECTCTVHFLFLQRCGNVLGMGELKCER